MKQSRQRVITGKELERTKEWAKKVVQQWHDEIHPNYIFLTETSGTLYGWVIKEAWRRAYPNEPIPRFYRIDPTSRGIYGIPTGSRLNWTGLGDQKTNSINYFSRRMTKDNPVILVFDEGHSRDEYTSPEYWKRRNVDLMGDLKLFSPPVENTREETNSADLAAGFIDKVLKGQHKGSKIYVSRQGLGTISFRSFVDPKAFNHNYHGRLRSRKPTSKMNHQMSPGTTYDEEYHFTDRRNPLYVKNPEHISLTGNIVKLPGQRRRAMQYVSELKEIGKEVGEELKKERERKHKGLEGTLAAISITGLIFSIFFLSGITGNAIGAAKPTSLIGIILILVGISSGGIYLYLKKKH